MNHEGNSRRRTARWSVGAAVAAALAASVCCLGPLILVGLGVSGAWIGGLSALEPYRPLFAVVTLGFLGLGFWRVYRRPKEVCPADAPCASPRAGRASKWALWLATPLVLCLLAAPSVIGWAAGSEKHVRVVADEQLTEVTMHIGGMTCEGCALAVRKSLQAVPGTSRVEVSFEPPQAKLAFDPSVTGVERLRAAIEAIGYSASVVAGNE